MAIEDLFKMKREPGVFVVGERNISAEALYDTICKKLYDFYEEKGLLFVPEKFEIEKDRYNCPIYIPEVPNMTFREDGTVQKKDEPKKHGYIAIEKFDEEKIEEYEKDWDFDHEPLRATQQVFGVYFNLMEVKKAKAERNAFFTYLKN